MTNKKPNHSIRPQMKLNSQFKIIEKDLCANEVNEEEDLEVVNKWKEQVEKEQMGRSERDRVRDTEEEANGEGIGSRGTHRIAKFGNSGVPGRPHFVAMGGVLEQPGEEETKAS